MEIQHAYTHFTLTEIAWLCNFQGEIVQEAVKWIPLLEMDNFPMGKVDRAIARKIITTMPN